MTRRIRQLMGRPASDEGFSLIELLVSMIVFSIAIAMIYTVLIKVSSKTVGSQQSADAVAQLRAALEDIDKQVRSGNVLYSPANENLPSCYKNTGLKSGTCMRIFTQTNVGVAVGGNPSRCVQWEVLPDGPATAGVLPAAGTTWSLRTRNWDPNWLTSTDVTAWRTVSRGLTVGGTLDPGTVPLPFTLAAASDYGSRLLDVKFEVKDTRDNNTATLQSSLSGRNTTYGYDAQLCTPVPLE